MCNFRLSKRTTIIIESIVFINVIVTVLGLFSLPSIFNFVTLEPYVPPILTTNESNNTITESNCSSALPLSWGQINSSSTAMIECILYTGTACKSFLTQWQQCAVGSRDGNIFVNVSESLQTEHESVINQLNVFLSSHTECHDIALPFLCQYFYPLSDCSTSYTASKEDCIDISTGICADIWQLAVTFGYASSLPDCNNLPIAVTNNGSSMLSGNNSTLTGNDTTTNTTLLQCRDDFVRIDSICEPRCDKFMQFSKTGSLLVIYAEDISSGICLIFSIIILILSIKNYKTQLKYPSILVFFFAIDNAVLSVLYVTVAIGRSNSKLFCSSDSLLKTIDNPTPFCIISGIVFHYSFMNMVLWWFGNVVVFFHKVMFPFQANRLEKLNRNKYIFAAIFAIAMIVPIPAIVICLTVSKFKYSQSRFPLTICITHRDMWFSSVILPYDVLLAIGLCLLIIVLWRMRRKNLFSKKHYSQVSVAEKKIVLVFLSFLILGVFILCLNGYLNSKEVEFEATLTQYFTCEAFGYEEGKCDHSTYANVYSPIMFAALYLFLSLLPLSILNYVLTWKSVKKAGVSMRKIASRRSLLNGESSLKVTSSENGNSHHKTDQVQNSHSASSSQDSTYI